ncbi:FecR domain-containing protein [Caulobacter sp. 1776]|uniref:FecR family protein n=1 Tax=Caulobacter sp. 1776 TaxID=3156420 RepID=UPI00339ACD9D
MTSTTSGKEIHDDPDSAAALWFARLQGDDVPPRDRREFERWLQADARNATAWEDLNHTWNDVAVVETDPAFAALRADALGAGDKRPHLDRRALGVAAAGLVVAVGGALLGRRWLGGADPLAPADEPVFTTAVGERSTFRLADNSVVTLSTDSAVRVNHWAKERRLTLLRGQAFFQVAKDPSRPFVVAAGDKRVTAVGTAFDVRMEPGRLSVTLVEGRVRIAADAPANGDGGERRVEMSAGSRFVAADPADWLISSVDTAKESAWLKGRLVFDGEPLSAVVAEMNRFSERKLTLSDPALGATPVSGVFKTGQIDAFVAALKTYGLAEVGRADATRVELVRPRA